VREQNTRGSGGVRSCLREEQRERGASQKSSDERSAFSSFFFSWYRISVSTLVFPRNRNRDKLYSHVTTESTPTNALCEETTI
jgi:hypothetical protein